MTDIQLTTFSNVIKIAAMCQVILESQAKVLASLNNSDFETEHSKLTADVLKIQAAFSEVFKSQNTTPEG